MRMSDWRSDVCSSDLVVAVASFNEAVVGLEAVVAVAAALVEELVQLLGDDAEALGKAFAAFGGRHARAGGQVKVAVDQARAVLTDQPPRHPGDQQLRDRKNGVAGKKASGRVDP